MKKLRILIFSILILFLVSCEPTKITKNYLAFGTYIDITIYNTDEEPFNYCYSFIQKMNNLTDKYQDYSNTTGVYDLNNSQGKETIIDSDLYDLIKLSIENRVLNIDNTSNFEIGIGKITDIYKDIFDNYNRETIDSSIFPSEELLNKSYLTDSSLITLNDELKSIIIPVGMKIDLGGVAKGYTLDRLREYLDSLNLKYVIDAGMSSISTNTINKDTGNYFKIGLINPNNLSNTYKTVLLKEGKVISTSGYYQKYFIYNNKTYSHIIDPRTNLSAETDILSISIITESGLKGDILSTTLYIMGKDKALEYINNNSGIEGIIYASDNKVYESNGFKEYTK